MQVVDPETAVHPLRLELDEDSVRDFIVRVHEDDETLTLDEIECAMDWLYDYIVSERQTVPGTTVLQ
jgi:cell division GTPase FtsZ